ncbi:hypothetical protein CP533_0193 [Ophiocordyceps camponoti-saundersi (nom. inval.)]|nr:hypothetical protein CP533_0193 [Ophiocordyceps camponoti-saundersi (nom. inval.)]
MLFQTLALALLSSIHLVSGETPNGEHRVGWGIHRFHPQPPPAVTPQPAQPNMVAGCQLFYLVRPGDTCASVAAANKVSLSRFVRWNPSVGSNCQLLLADHWACIAAPDAPIPPPPPAPVTTPTPIQPGMVGNCRRFHYVEPAETCEVVEAMYNVSFRDLLSWNPAIGADCTNMWANTYLCVGL